MASFLVRSNLSRGDLRLYLSNENGYAQDAAVVRWTVLDASGSQVSGKSIQAIRAAVGEYYAPWFSDVRNGNYSVKWEISETRGSAPKVIVEPFFVVDPSSYQCCGASVCADGIPLPGGLAYLSGTNLGPGDLPLYLKDDDGILRNAYAVFWTIQDSAGNPLSSRSPAVQWGLGSYFAPWYVNTASGDYTVLWEFMQNSDSPMQSAILPFSVINPAAPIVTEISANDPNNCGCSAPPQDSCCGSISVLIPAILTNISTPTVSCGAPAIVFSSGSCNTGPAYVPSAIPYSNQCCDIQIPRTIHLAIGSVPPSGNFTDQPQYVIPAGVRHITFYISYQRGAVGGYALFKLLWGNGTEESQETVIDTDISGPTVLGQQGMFLQDLTGPTPADNNTINFVLYVSVPGGAKTVRLLASEAGVPGSPGIVGITLTASSD